MSTFIPRIYAISFILLAPAVFSLARAQTRNEPSQETQYTQWHGNFEVAQRFYTEFVPELREVIAKGLQSRSAAKVKAARAVQSELNQVLKSDLHRWFEGGMTPAERKERRKAAGEFKKRYAQP